MSRRAAHAMSALEFHVLLAMAGGARHGYAIREAVERESDGALTPRAGSLYRVIARLVTVGLAAETAPDGEPQPHPGLERRYYALTAAGRRALAAEARRLKRDAALTEERLGILRGEP